MKCLQLQKLQIHVQRPKNLYAKEFELKLVLSVDFTLFLLSGITLGRWK